MSASAGRLAAYVPRLLRAWGDDAPCREFPGTLVLVDISGFTRLSERLARKGKVGAEELADAINHCFAALLAVAYEGGGSLIKFGGDALLLWFSGGDHPARAARAAFGMRRTLRAVGRFDTSSGPVRLRMSVGVHSGTMQFFVVGDSHRELIVSGPCATETARMEAAAAGDEILVSSATAAVLPARVLGPGKDSGRLLRREPEAEQEPVDLDAPDDATLRPYIPAAIRERLGSELQEPEHRRATVAFVKFTAFDQLLADEGPGRAAAELDRLVRTVQAATSRHDVAFLGSDIDENGGKLILAAGAPDSRGNDEERMLLALREIADQHVGLPVQIGVNAGRVFAGDIGPHYRRTYTVMGDAVNLAARVMARARPGQVLATASVLDTSETLFETVPLEPFKVKGKTEPVEASLVGPVVGSRHDELEQLPLIGRVREAGAFERAVDGARAGTGRLLVVSGEPGIGKTRLVEEFAAQAEGLRALMVACELHESSTPYLPIRRLLRNVLSVAPEASADDACERLRGVVNSTLPELRPWLPLLAILLGVELADTPETAQLEERFRRVRLNHVATQLLAELVPEPSLLVVEDVHWMDEASADFMAHLALGLAERPWVVCVTRRDVDAGFVPTDAPVLERLSLAPLDPDATTALAVAATDEAPLPQHEIAAVVERSGGNPLFLRELVAATRVAGSVDELPDSVESLVTARIDRLPPRDRTVLRHVSVLGRSFDRTLADAVLPEDTRADDERMWRRLGDFLAVDAEMVAFRNALIRDAAYEGLRFRLRRELHADVGQLIERSAGAAADEQAELLSFHFFHAQRDAEAWRYSLTAAESAAAIYANADAARFYERALDAARRVEDLTPLEVARVHELLGDVRDRMGAYREAAAAYRSARRILPADPVAEARLMLKQAQQQGWLSRYETALRWIRRGLKALEGTDTPDAARQRAQLTVWYARFCEEEGRHRLAMRWCQRAIDQASASGEPEALAHAFKLIDVAHAQLGQLKEAKYSEKALAIYEELGDLAGQGAVLNNMAIFADWQGEWHEALDRYQQSLGVYERAGDEVGVANAKYNIALLLYDQGRLPEAASMLREALRTWQAGGYRAKVARAKQALARVATRSGDHAEARSLLDNAHAEFVDIGARVEVVDTLSALAESHLFEGDGPAALRVVSQAVEQAEALGGVSSESPWIHRIRGYALMQLGDLDGARDALNQSLADGRLRHADYDVALTLRALGDLAATLGEPASEELTAESARILERLGVMLVPEVPLRT